jgi:hypothetical protein
MKKIHHEQQTATAVADCSPGNLSLPFTASHVLLPANGEVSL